MSNKPKRITDFFDATHLQKFQDSFAQATKVTTVVVDQDGRQITRPSNWNRFCELFFASDVGAGECQSSIQSMLEENRNTGEPAIHICPNTGLYAATVPIFYAEHFLGSWVFGQLRIEDPDDHTLKRAADKIGISFENAKALLHALPVFTMEDFAGIQNFLKTINSIFIQLGVSYQKIERSAKELRGITKQLDSNARLTRKFLDSGDVSMYVCDFYTGELLMVNDAYCKQSGQPCEALIGQKCWDINGSPCGAFCSDCPRDELLDENNMPAAPYCVTVYNAKLNAWLRCTHQAIEWANGRMAHMVTQCDITQEHRMREELTRVAYYDKYTGLPNSEKLTVDLRKVSFSGRQYLVNLRLAFLRKFINVYGREKGYELFRLIAAWIEQQAYPNSRLYRGEGDSLCLLLKHTERAEADRITGEIKNRFEESWQLGAEGQEMTYYCSANLSMICLNPSIRNMDMLSLIERTLSSARVSNSIFVYDEAIDRQEKEHLALELTLKSCVVSGMQGFGVHYQPIVNTRTGVWQGLEALCRWDCPGKGRVSPMVFIHEAEQLGIIGTIGEWVLETAIRQCKAYGLDDNPAFFLSVNISPLQIMEEDFAGRVGGILQRYDYPGDKLNLEITESAELSFTNFTMSVIEALRSFGIKMALDDFGTGYSTFNSLKNLPVDYLKTERDFILDIETDNYQQYYYFVMAEIAHANNMALIAEGIETKEQLDIIKNNGADFIQGYYFSRPLSAQELEENLQRFQMPAEPVLPERTEHININRWLNGKNAYALTPNLFKLLNQCMQILMTSGNLNDAFPEVLKIIGTHFDVAHAFAYMQVEGLAFRNLHMWHRDALPEMCTPAYFNIIETASSVMEAFRADGMLIASDIAYLAPELYDTLHASNIHSIAMLPMWDDDVLIGFVGMSAETYREWSPEEIIMLWNMGMIMSGNVKRENLISEVDHKQRLLMEVLNSTGLNVFVSDLETDEILWVNDVIRKKYAIGEEMVGRKCYEIIQGREARCPFCKVGELLASPECSQISFEHHNERWDRTFIVYDSIIQWDGGKRVHIEYSLDITDYKKTQKQLEYFAKTDIMTGAYNRNALMITLKEMLRDAQENDKVLSVAFVDADRLKLANDTYGHHTGDMLLTGIVEALRACIRSDDVIGRIGGDEFVVLFPNCRNTMAEKRLIKAQETLAAREETPVPFSFSYGLSESIEVDGQDEDERAKEILGIADRRMLANKKQYTPKIVSIAR